MNVVSLNMAASLVGVSTRTLRRRMADGSLAVVPDIADSLGRTFLALEEIENDLRIALGREDWPLVQAADMGQAQAQCELGLMMLEQDMEEEGVRWLRCAAEHFYPEAMYQLGCILLQKQASGEPADLPAACEMIARAAQYGHVIATHMLSCLECDGDEAADCAALLGRIEAEEQEMVLRALETGAI